MRGLDISNDVGCVKGEVGRWRGERGQGRRTLAFILTLDAKNFRGALRAGGAACGTVRLEDLLLGRRKLVKQERERVFAPGR